MDYDCYDSLADEIALEGRQEDEGCEYCDWEVVEDDYDDSMDGDFDSAMESAGYGTNEDYGYYGGEDY